MSEEVQNLEFKEKNSSKLKLILIASILLVILLILVFSVRAYAKNYYINKNSDILQKTLLENINKVNANIRHLEFNSTADTLEIKQRLQENKDYIENQINDLETKGSAKMWDMDKTLSCDGKTINYEPGNIPACNDLKVLEDRGFKEFTVNGTNAIMSLTTNSQQITLIEYFLDVLEENKYELKNQLLEVKGDLEEQNQLTSEIKEKISNIQSNSGAVIAQTLDSLSYLSKKMIIWQTMKLVIIDNGKNIQTIKKADKEISLPSEQQISQLELKEDCMNMFKSTGQYSETLKTSTTEKMLLLSSSISNICDNLINYQKQNAIKMLKRAEIEKNPFISIENKLYLNLLVNCKSEWFSFDNNKPCTTNYLDEFKSKFS